MFTTYPWQQTLRPSNWWWTRFAERLSQIAFAQFALIEFQDQPITNHRKRRVVARTFVPHECMSPVEFMPRELDSRRRHCVVNQGAAFSGNVRVLAAPDHQHFGFDFSHPVERVVAQPFSEAALVNV